MIFKQFIIYCVCRQQSYDFRKFDLIYEANKTGSVYCLSNNVCLFWLRRHWTAVIMEISNDNCVSVPLQIRTQH